MADEKERKRDEAFFFFILGFPVPLFLFRPDADFGGLISFFSLGSILFSSFQIHKRNFYWAIVKLCYMLGGVFAVLAMGSWLGFFVISLDGHIPSVSEFPFLCLILSMLWDSCQFVPHL